MRQTKAARSRRVDPLPGLTLNLEILGAGLLTAALILGVALALPVGRSGSFGMLAAAALRGGFGEAAWLAVALLAALGIIIFLELHAMRRLVLLSMCVALEFLVLTGWLGLAGHGGLVGNALGRVALWIFGPIGANIAFGFGAVAFAVVPTGISLKATFSALGRAISGVWSTCAAAVASLRRRAQERAQAMTLSTPMPVRTQPSDLVRSAVEASPPPEQAPLIEATPLAPGPAVAAPVPAEIVQTPVMLDRGDAVAAPVPVPLEVRRQLKRTIGDTPSRPISAGGYRLPDYALFNPPEKRVYDEASAALVLEETLASFGISAKVTHIERGPSVTRYEITPGKGVKVSAIKSLADNIQLALAAQSIRIEAPIPGKAAVGIEVPNSAVATVGVREILDYLPRGEDKLFFALGKDITGRPIVGDLTRMPHLLVAGATGAGKSVCLNVILTSLLSTCTPDQVQLLLIDPKRVELTSYNGIPHLIKDCITDPKLAAGALYELTKEMDQRYELFARAGVRKIEEYNAGREVDRLPYIVVVIDELADLMLVAPTRVETSICRIAQLARATGIHLVVATQRPSVDVITGLIKANIPSRIAFAVSSQVDSRTIIDMAGAERLLGRGDMLYLPIDAPKPVRVQGALVTGDELERLCEFWRYQDDPANRLEIELSEVEEDGRGPSDELAFDAAKIIIERQMASVALLQAELKVGHPRAVRLMKILEEFRVVGPTEGTKPRKILVGTADIDKLAELLAVRSSEQSLL
jgi:S-DNA-T family DNA segregation ATPase FtsK/SpoIIIE